MKSENHDANYRNEKSGRVPTNFEKKAISHSAKSEFRRGLGEIKNMKRVLYNKRNNKN